MLLDLFMYKNAYFGKKDELNQIKYYMLHRFEVTDGLHVIKLVKEFNQIIYKQ